MTSIAAPMSSPSTNYNVEVVATVYAPIYLSLDQLVCWSGLYCRQAQQVLHRSMSLLVWYMNGSDGTA